MSIQERVAKQEKIHSRAIAAQMVLENLDKPIGEVIEELKGLHTEAYHSALMEMTTKELMMFIVDSTDEPVEEEKPKNRRASTRAKKASASSSAEKPKAKPKAAKSDGGKKRKKKAPPRTESKATGKDDKKEPSPRSAQRDAFDDIVFKAVKEFANAEGRVSMAEIKDHVSGSPAQIRASLNRLIEEQKINFEGQTRATRYFIP